MLFDPVINEKCPHYIETFRMPESVGTVYVPLLKYPPAVMYVLTTKSIDSTRDQLWSPKTKVNQDYLLKKILPVPGSVHILPSLSIQLLG